MCCAAYLVDERRDPLCAHFATTHVTFNPLDSDGKFMNNISVLSGGAGNVDSLFQSLDHVSRAVGTLVNIMTDDEAADSQSVPPTSARVGQSRAPYQ